MSSAQKKRSREHNPAHVTTNIDINTNSTDTASSSSCTSTPPTKKRRIDGSNYRKQADNGKHLVIWYQLSPFTQSQIDNILKHTHQTKDRPLILFGDNDIDNFCARWTKNPNKVPPPRRRNDLPDENSKLLCKYDDMSDRNKFLSMGIITTYKNRKNCAKFDDFAQNIDRNFQIITSVIEKFDIKFLLIPSKYHPDSSPKRKRRKGGIVVEHNLNGVGLKKKHLQYIQSKIDAIKSKYARNYFFTELPFLAGDVANNYYSVLAQHAEMLKQKHSDSLNSSKFVMDVSMIPDTPQICTTQPQITSSPTEIKPKANAVVNETQDDLPDLPPSPNPSPPRKLSSLTLPPQTQTQIQAQTEIQSKKQILSVQPPQSLPVRSLQVQRRTSPPEAVQIHRAPPPAVPAPDMNHPDDYQEHVHDHCCNYDHHAETDSHPDGPSRQELLSANQYLSKLLWRTRKELDVANRAVMNWQIANSLQAPPHYQYRAPPVPVPNEHALTRIRTARSVINCVCFVFVAAVSVIVLYLLRSVLPYSPDSPMLQYFVYMSSCAVLIYRMTRYSRSAYFERPHDTNRYDPSPPPPPMSMSAMQPTGSYTTRQDGYLRTCCCTVISYTKYVIGLAFIFLIAFLIIGDPLDLGQDEFDQQRFERVYQVQNDTMKENIDGMENEFETIEVEQEGFFKPAMNGSNNFHYGMHSELFALGNQMRVSSDAWMQFLGHGAFLGVVVSVICWFIRRDIDVTGFASITMLSCLVYAVGYLIAGLVSGMYGVHGDVATSHQERLDVLWWFIYNVLLPVFIVFGVIVPGVINWASTSALRSVINWRSVSNSMIVLFVGYSMIYYPIYSFYGILLCGFCYMVFQCVVHFIVNNDERYKPVKRPTMHNDMFYHGAGRRRGAGGCNPYSTQWEAE